MNIRICGHDILTCCGNLQETWSALASQAGIDHIRYDKAGGIVSLAAIRHLGDKFGSPARYTRLLEELFSTLPRLPEDTALVFSTTKGAVDELFHTSSPSQCQPWTVADEAARILSLSGPTSCISAACASGTIAIVQGAMRILRGECRAALIVGCDILCDFIIGGFQSLKALSPTTCRPFDTQRDGLLLGEGAGWMVLAAEDENQDHGEEHYLLSGYGISCDATHITAPCRHGSGLIRALQQIFPEGSTPPGGINAHGTGTVYNDAMELTAYTRVFEQLPPICAVKGAVGHCLGAAGIIEASLSLKSLETGVLPPTFGLQNVETAVQRKMSGTAPLNMVSPSILSCNSGFGGINAAVHFVRQGH